MRRIFGLAVLLGVMLMGMQSVPVVVPIAADGSTTASPQTTCIRMSISTATTIFTHVSDGSHTLSSEWSVKNSRAIEFASGSSVHGLIPRDYIASEADIFVGLEGKLFKNYDEGSFTVTCVPNPGTSHPGTRPQHCPVGDTELSNQIAKSTQNTNYWYTGSGGPGYYSLAEYSKPGSYGRKPALKKLPALTVPFQGKAVDLNTGVVYTPGYAVRPTTWLDFYCYSD